MKKIFLVGLLFISNLIAQQNYYTFYQLKGVEDQTNNTQLFYKMYNFQNIGAPFPDYFTGSTYHFDVENNSDTLFLFTGRFVDSSTFIADLEFWGNNPSTYIYLYGSCYSNCNIYIRRYDIGLPTYWESAYDGNIEISKQNDSMLVASIFGIVRSFDGGLTWYDFADFNYSLISISPFNDNNIFVQNGSKIYKTTNGYNMVLVDTVVGFDLSFYYDKDSTHIYCYNYADLRVSDDQGNANSWTEIYDGVREIFPSVDYSQSGSIYFADGRYIYHSTDYGSTFNEFKVLDRKIVGIYKKPNSDILYASTKYDLYEITPDTIDIIKHLSIGPDVFEWFPLAVGNTWIYDSYSLEGISREFTGTKYMKVVKDTLIENQNYFVIENEFSSAAVFPAQMFLRIDSTTGFIYRYWAELDSEYIFHDLYAERGDIIYNPLNPNETFYYLESLLPINYLGSNTMERWYSENSNCTCHHNLIKGFGLASTYFLEVYGEENILKGCLIEGVVYGDTTFTDVNDEQNPIPTEYKLEQNYPNPFNPNTTINYQIPKAGNVTLKVFDVLGREVVTLVNEYRNAGSYEVEFNTSSINHHPLLREYISIS
jgi:hypothetical protein